MGFADRFRLDGRTALVTGSSRGIGRAVALGLAEFGADVVVHCGGGAPGDVDAAAAVAGEVAAMGRRVVALDEDLSLDGAAGRLARAAIDRMARVDLLVLNASVQCDGGWKDVTREQFDLQVAVNFRSSFELMQLLLPGMVERKWGRVVAVGSTQQHRPDPRMPIYAATKCAQHSLVMTLAKQVASHGVTVNTVSPGVVDTDRNAHVLRQEKGREFMRKLIPTQFVGEPEDCVGAVLLCCSEAGRYITGAELSVDGGWGLR